LSAKASPPSRALRLRADRLDFGPRQPLDVPGRLGEGRRRQLAARVVMTRAGGWSLPRTVLEQAGNRQVGVSIVGSFGLPGL
jgi:hypothetical protein